MPALRSTTREDDFDAVLIDELETLRTGEQRLRRLFPQLEGQPQLREYFLRELAEIQLRADRLEAVLNPLGVFDAAHGLSAPTLSPAA